MDTEFDGAVEDALVTLYGDAVNINVHLRRNNLSHFEQQSYSVNSRELDGGIKEKLLVHVPFGIEYSLAIS